MNPLERILPRTIREKMATLIVTALGLFLALQYNETISAIIHQYFPLETSTLIAKIVYIVALTIVIIYASTLVEKGLDGR